jgi:uncharacterized repeat protein (TIGR03803 family)
MKTLVKHPLLLAMLLASGCLILPGRAMAQTFTNLYSFSATPAPGYTNSEGVGPIGDLKVSGNTLYGTASAGGISGNGTVFRLNLDGTGITNLHSFSATPAPNYTNSDGASPQAGLLFSGNTLYGTTAYGGAGGVGTVFRLNADGTGFTNLHSFAALSGALQTNSDGAYPIDDLVLSGNTLYGTAYQGGSAGNGTVFKLNTDGTGFTNLHVFTATSGNSDGIYPIGGLVLLGNTLYGTATSGGAGGDGTVFALNTNGTGFTNVHVFTATSGPLKTNSDGAYPHDGLVLSGSTLYGTTVQGGLYGNTYTAYGSGTIFKVDIDGTGFTNLHSFAAANTNGSGYITNSDGANPNVGLTLSGSTLYGTADVGGSGGVGTVFAINIDGTRFVNLHSFPAIAFDSNYTNSDGALPSAGLILSGNTLYGTSGDGGTSGNGTVFSITLPRPQLALVRSATNAILTWPTNSSGLTFTLQSITNLASSGVWTTVAPGPVIVNGQNTVTNPISGTRKFYRLSQ